MLKCFPVLLARCKSLGGPLSASRWSQRAVGCEVQAKESNVCVCVFTHSLCVNWVTRNAVPRSPQAPNPAFPHEQLFSVEFLVPRDD